MAEDIHELVEAVVGENIAAIQKRLEDLELGRADAESQLTELKILVSEIKDNFLALHEDTSHKLSEYNSKLDTIAGQISGLKTALEKLFTKVK